MKRTDSEKAFGIQIDSLADVISFGILPATIGYAIYDKWGVHTPLHTAVTVGVLGCYVLAGLIRLAYFNVTEEERQRTEGGVRKTYVGLPVTSAALIFPSVMLFRFILPVDISVVYFPVALITGFLFLSKLQIPKPHLRGILIMIGIGVVECILLLTFFFLRHG